MNPRTLKIEETGDFFRGKVNPKIRLMGKWLQAAGFHPGQQVKVMLVQPGVLELRVCSPVQLKSADFTAAIKRFERLGI